MQGNQHSDAFPQRCTYNEFLDVRTNPKKAWKRRYFVLSNNFLLCGRTPYCETLERVTALEGSKIELCMSRSQIQTQMGSQSQTQNQEPHQTNKNSKNNNRGNNNNNNNNNNSNDSKRRSFNLTLRSGKVLYFRALSIKQCDEWINHIERASTLKIKDIYRFLYTLGTSESQLTKVVAAKHRLTGEACAIKIVDKRTCHQGMLKSEIKILKKLDNPYIVTIYDLFETKKYAYIVMEKCDGGELFDQIAELDGDHYGENDCLRVMFQIASGVRYMHKMGIVHRDLKPENILCVEKDSIRKIKIADFGISKMVKNSQNIDKVTFKTLAGTLSYTAPEILRGKGYNKAVDCWSIGIIVYILLCGYAPFWGDTDTELSYEILKSEVPFEDEDWKHVSENTKELVAGLLDKDPQTRATLDDIVKLVWENTSARMPLKTRHKFRNTLIKRKKLRMSTPNTSYINMNRRRHSRYVNNNTNNNNGMRNGNYYSNGNNGKRAGSQNNYNNSSNSSNNGHSSNNSGRHGKKNGYGGNARHLNNFKEDAVSELTLPWHERDSMIIKEDKKTDN